jgi:hypothetical protein
MSRRADVQAALKRIDCISRWAGRRLFDELPNILHHGERVERIVQGTYHQTIGLAVATDRRFMFITFEGVSPQVDDFAYPNIRAIESRTGWLFGELTVVGPGLRATITQVLSEQVRDLAEHVRTRPPLS